PHLAELSKLNQGDNEKRDRVLEAIAHIQGFDAHPDKGPLDPNREILYRGFGDRHDQSNGPELARQYTDGAYYGSTGHHGNGAYFTTREDRAAGYGYVMQAQLKPGAKVIDGDAAWDLADHAPDEWKPIIGDDPGRAAAMYGYDAIRPNRGSSVIVLNRG